MTEAKLKDDLELDESPEFNELIEACRRGDLKRTQELISGGVNPNGKDKFDYTPLILASLCGHYELVRLLLESGASAERDSFQGERCVYNALTDKIRNLLLKYDYSKSTDTLQPWAAHITSLFKRKTPKTSDITLAEGPNTFELHKFILSARSPYFETKLRKAPDTATWKLLSSIPVESFQIVLRYLYLGDVPSEVVDARSSHTKEEVRRGIDKISRQLEISNLWETISSGKDRQLVRQRYQEEVSRAQSQINAFFNKKVLGQKMIVDTREVSKVEWPHGNAVFADCLLRADEEIGEEADQEENLESDSKSRVQDGTSKPRKSYLYPVHKAMLIRSPYFKTMFSSAFKEAKESQHLHIIKVVCLPKILEIVLRFLYTERMEFPLDLALDVLYASDYLLLDRLKNKAAALINTLGNGNNNLLIDRTHGGDNEVDDEVEPINVYDVTHAAWELRVRLLETFAARYFAYRLEYYIKEKEFAELIRESAGRVKNRQETDTIELLDEIRSYIDQRFKLGFDGTGLDTMLTERDEVDASATEALSSEAQVVKDTPGSTGLVNPNETFSQRVINGSGVRTLDGELVEDEFVADIINRQILLDKIEDMLKTLELDA
ncbi:BTB/POZ domain-containing protein [Nemania sp. FL0031]|nr:BTB/POZ domain-containing protein [Nemania sp. FL0031]